MKSYMDFQDTASKRISYVLITKDRPKYLAKALLNCRNLVQANDELIVVNGGPDDEIDHLIDGYSDIVNIYISESDLSAPEAFNKGFLLTRGKYIKVLQDDDVFYPEAMEQAVKVMDETPELDLMVCGGTRVRDGKVGWVYARPGSNYGKLVDDVYKNTRSGAGFFFRRRILHRVGLWEVDSVASDAAFLIRSVSLKATVKFCRINMFYHELHADSISIRDQQKKYVERDRQIRRYCSERFQKEWFRRKSLPRRALRAARRVVTTGRLRQPPQERPAPIWDGGFS